MPVDADAILTDQHGRAVLRFERALRHPPDRVWAALTEPAEHCSWHPTPFELEPEVGGRVSYLPGGDAPEMPAGEVTEYEPPRVLAHTWDEDLLRWELRPDGDGCLLVLTHTFDDRFKAARDAAGWHVCLDALAATLAGCRARRMAKTASVCRAAGATSTPPTRSASTSRTRRRHRRPRADRAQIATLQGAGNGPVFRPRYLNRGKFADAVSGNLTRHRVDGETVDPG